MPSIPIREIKLRARITQKFSRELDELLNRISTLIDNPTILQQILRAAAAETLLAAYRERFLNNLSDALNMERVSKPKSPPTDTKAIRRAKDSLTELSQELNEAKLGGRPTGALDKKLRKAEERLTEALDKNFGGSELSTGMFRPLALQVLSVLTTLGQAQDQENSISLGIGHLPTLDKIKTPSATPFLTGHPTSSSLNTLWRHLEFGTGIYAAKKGVNSDSPYKMSSGGWWYGPRPGQGLRLKGSRGVHALFDGQGAAYEPDAFKFETVFAQMLTRALHG